MKKFITKSTALLSLLAVVACSEEALVENVLTNDGTIKEINITGKDFQFDGETRSSVTISESGASFTWDEDDVIGIFPNIGDQVSFAMDKGAGTQTATFSGGGWALKSSATYAAYYPHVYENRDMTKIPVSYLGQTQNGNNNTDHIGTYDFMAAAVSTPSKGSVAFDMQHLGCLVQLTITIPQPATLNKVTLVSNGEFTQKGTMDLTSEEITIASTSVSNTFEVDIVNVKTTTEDEDVVVYFMLPPTDLSSNSLKVQISTDSNEELEYSLSNRNFVAGKIYALRASDIPTYHVGTAGSLSSMISSEEKNTITKIKITGELNGDDIRFIREMGGSDEDGFDTDGILKVLDIQDATIIKGGRYYYDDGDDYYYAENNIVPPYMFAECTSLTTIKLARNATSIGYSAFRKCSNLTSVTISDATTSIGSNAFNYCEKLKDVIIPNSVVKINSNAFYGCHSLTTITIPGGVTTIAYDAFDWCNGFTEFIVDDSNQNYSAVDGILYNKDVTDMLICPYAYTSDNLVIPSTVKTLASFKLHTGLKGKVTIPGSVKNIPYQGFMNTRITEVVMEEGVESIGSEAFRGTNLEKVTMPSTIKSFGDRVFYANRSLAEIYYYGSPLYISSSLQVFYDIASSCKLYVPKGTKESFVNSSSWSYYFSESNIIEMEN